MHPGRILLEEFLAPRGISVWHLAKDIGVSARRIYEIVQGERSINADIAHRLAHYFGISERYWLELQRRHDEAKAAIDERSLRKAGASIRRITGEGGSRVENGKHTQAS